MLCPVNLEAKVATTFKGKHLTRTRRPSERTGAGGCSGHRWKGEGEGRGGLGLALQGLRTPHSFLPSVALGGAGKAGAQANPVRSVPPPPGAPPGEDGHVSRRAAHASPRSLLLALAVVPGRLTTSASLTGMPRGEWVSATRDPKGPPRIHSHSPSRDGLTDLSHLHRPSVAPCVNLYRAV